VSEVEWTILGIVGGLVWLIASLVVARIQYQSKYTHDEIWAMIWPILFWPFIVMWLIVVWEKERK
jgi:hypothetical protein